LALAKPKLGFGCLSDAYGYGGYGYAFAYGYGYGYGGMLLLARSPHWRRTTDVV
jgi:hypothetical protein